MALKIDDLMLKKRLFRNKEGEHMMTFFRMMRVLNKEPLKPTAKKTLQDLIHFTQRSAPQIAPNSKVAEDILINWEKSPKEFVEFYKQQGISKTESTLRSQINFFSNILYSIFGSHDYIYSAFVNNNEEDLKIIKNRIYAMDNGAFSLSDLSINLVSLLPFSADELDTDDMEMIDAALLLLKRINKRDLVKALDTFNSDEKRITMATVLKILNTPMLMNESFEYCDGNQSYRGNRLVFNEEKCMLLNRMKELDEALPANASQKEEPLDIPYNFLSMSEICEEINHFLNQSMNEERRADIGKTSVRAGFFAKIITDRSVFREFLEKNFNPYDLYTEIVEYRK